MKKLSSVMLTGVLAFFPAPEAGRASAPAGKTLGPVVGQAGRQDLSPPLRELLPPVASESGFHVEVNPIAKPDLPPRRRASKWPDALRQTRFRPFSAAPETPLPSLNFEGISDDDNAAVVGFRIVPPDPEGDIGPDHYVQWINLAMAVWEIHRDGDGNPVAAIFDADFGVRPGNALFSGFGGICESTNDGDPIVLYDHLADRWFLSQFAINFGVQCLAVSTGPDPTGSYYRYEFTVSPGQQNDYPKFGLMPDAYYLTLRDFPSGTGNFAAAVAFDRAALLAGAANPTFIKFGLPCLSGDCPDGIQPPHLEGPAPPAGTPGIFTRIWDDDFDGPLTGVDGYRLWEFSADFDQPSHSTFKELAIVPAGASFNNDLCGFFNRSCLPQASVAQKLDSADELQMYRAQYRHFAGSHDSILIQQTVDATGSDVAGIRWAELRGSGGGWSLHQEGTYAPADGLGRFMGSAAMDGKGNIALGYNVTGSAVDPSIRYTSRTSGDPLGTFPGGEVELQAGTGAQIGSNRWGDYTSMSVDPVADCTFWFTSEYYANTASFDFKTRIGAFQIPSCGKVAGCTADADCDDGLSCNGTESCDTSTGACLDGVPLDCDDGVACTVDACDEAGGGCRNTPNDLICDNGLYCDGLEICDLELGCWPGTPPNCDDGVACTVDACDEGFDTCRFVANDLLCDNGLYCDGSEVCDAALGCQAGSPPCGLLGCDENADSCSGSPEALLEAGGVVVGAEKVSVSLANTYTNAVVVATVQYQNNTAPVVTRVSNITATSFDLRLQSAGGGSVAAEYVSYLVAEEGSWVIDGVQIEARRFLSTITDENGSWVGQPQGYLGSFSQPVVLGQVMSENDPDFSVFWTRGAERFDPPSPYALAAGKTVAEDPDVSRTDEAVGFIIIEAGHGTIAGVEFEAALGPDTVLGVDNTPPYIYSFNTPFTQAPSVALLTMAGVDGANGGWAQIHGPTLATTTSLYLSVDEDQFADSERRHTNEQVGYLALAGPVVFPAPGEPVAEWGEVRVEGTPLSSYGPSTTVHLAQTYRNPVVVTTIRYANNTSPVVTRISNVTESSFDIRLQTPSGGAMAWESVFYLVVEEGDHQVDGVALSARKYNSTITDRDDSWVGEPQLYGQFFDQPVVLGQVMSDNDPDFTVFWTQGGARTEPPSSWALTTGKSVCEDPDGTRLDETIGYVVIESGHGSLGGIEYEAALGPDSVRGMGDLPPYPYIFDTPFPAAPAVTLTTMSGVDGANGGWAYVLGATATELWLGIEEDQMQDTERNHTDEQVSYVVFAAPGALPQ